MDIVYLVKKNKDNIELRYSLRSLENIPHDKVFIIGDKIDWIKNVIHIPFKDDGHKYENVRRKQRFILDCPNISEDFVYMNDDFYFLEPTDKVEYYKIGTLKDQMGYIYDRDEENRNRGLNPPKYYENLEHVYNIFGNVNSMETHTPIVFNKQKMKNMLEEYPDLPPTSIRTAYCAYNGIKGKFLPNTPNYKGYKRKLIDCKAYNKENFGIMEGQPLLSTENTILNSDCFHKYILSRFPNKCKYELLNINEILKMKFKAEPKYVVCVGNSMIKFNTKGIYETDDQKIIELLSKNPNIKTLGDVEMKDVEEEVKEVEIIEEVKDVKEDIELKELQDKFFEKFGKHPAPAYKTRKERLKSKLA